MIEQTRLRILILAATCGAFIALGIVGLGAWWLALQPAAWSASSPAAHAGRAEYISASTPTSFRSAAKAATPAVVHISTRQEQPLTMWDYYFGRSAPVREGSGSGVIYTADGYIITNNHVVAGANQIEVSLNDNRRFAATLVGTYPAADLAVLKIEAAQLPTIRVGNSDFAQIGDWVLAIGNPYNLQSTVTAGIVSAVGRDIGIINDRNAIESFIQTDAAINPGNSGGALVNAEGELVGINTAIYSRSGGYSGYGFAIPANLAARIVDDLIATGSYRQVVLGIEASQLDSDYARELGLPVSVQGIVIEDVDPAGAASRSGILRGDVVVEVRGRTVGTISQFREALGSSRRDEGIELTVLRQGQRRKVVLRL